MKNKIILNETILIVIMLCSTLFSCKKAATDPVYNWKKVGDVDGAVYPRNIFFANDNTGYMTAAVGSTYYAAFYKTTDGGAHWISLPSFWPAGAILVAIFFINENTGYVSVDRAIYKTTDGGWSWQISCPATNNGVLMMVANSIFFKDSANGWAAEMYGQVIRTKDAGKTWQQVPVNKGSGSGDDYCKVAFADAKTGFIFGRAYTYKTSDSGNTWNIISVPAGTGYDGCVIDSNNIYAIPSAVSKDGGQTWKQSNLGGDYVAFETSTHGFCSSLNTNFYKNVHETFDGGQTWTGYDLGLDFNLSNFFMVRKGLCYANAGPHIMKWQN